VRLLLDTQILLWIIDGTLGMRHRRLHETVRQEENQSHASIASLWEIAIKTRSGKLEIDLNLADLPEFLSAQGIVLLMIEPEHALTPLAVDVPTKDPFDRLLLAQAQLEGMSFLTVDRALADHPVTFR
jgi:PIN domain nuclease of toxin-antitoxin system